MKTMGQAPLRQQEAVDSVGQRIQITILCPSVIDCAYALQLFTSYIFPASNDFVNRVY